MCKGVRTSFKVLHYVNHITLCNDGTKWSLLNIHVIGSLDFLCMKSTLNHYQSKKVPLTV